MPERKIIAVVGATGAQGGGLARAILDDPEGGFAVRALTRNPDSDAARALADRGAEVARADLDDPESVRKAFEGAYGAYCVTNFWEHFSPDREKEQARAMAKAGAAAGLRHAIWSTLDDTREFVPLDDDRMPTLMDRYKVPHFDAKAEADPYFHQAEVPTTFLLTTAYWDNFIHFGWGPQRGEDGVARFVMPMGDSKLAGIAAEDIGRCAYGVFLEGPEALAGEYVGISGDQLTGDEMAEILSRHMGEDVEYQSVPADAYRDFGFPGAEDIGNMFQFYEEFADEFCASRPVERARELNPRLQSFEDWARKNADRIPIVEK